MRELLRREFLAARSALTSRFAAFDSPAANFYLILGTTIMLVAIGLVMVLSSSSVSSMTEGGSPFSVFAKQLTFAVIGLPLMWVCSRLSVRTWKRLAWPAILLAVCFQALVFTPLGFGVGGNRNWVNIGGFTAQPSEAAKLALVVWCALILALKGNRLGEWRELLVPFAPVVLLVLGLVLKGHDLGTGLVLMCLLAAMLFVAGVRGRLFALGFGAAATVAAVMVASSANRRERLSTWLSGECADIYGTCWQSTHGLWALASGGWWGLGLGASKEKWDWLPEAHNDYIFAIIGEELGIPGTFVILLLFALLAIGCLRIISRHPDPFVKLATTGVMAWVIGQALMNIGVVIGLLPVIGVPLPLVSSGGSALITTLAALGMVLSFARSEPDAGEVLSSPVAVARRSSVVTSARSRR
ncbi:MAG: putative lipid II flippase FtsW [Actinomycetales bacterium]